MSGKALDRTPSSNRSTKKLRAVSVVCSLTSSWQRWVTENESKQASEPGGWAPPSLGGGKEEPRKTRAPEKAPSIQTQSAGERHAEGPASPGASSGEKGHASEEPLLSPRIQTKQVVKTVSSSVQEKGAGINFLAEKIQKEALPSGEEVDGLLKRRSSPTRRRKCSNVVSSLTNSWKQVEKRLVGDGTERGEETTRSDKEDVQKQESNVLKAEEDDDSEGESVRIKRPPASM